MYGGFSWSKNSMAISNHADTVLLARLRTSHTPLLKAYGNLFCALTRVADPSDQGSYCHYTHHNRTFRHDNDADYIAIVQLNSYCVRGWG